MSVNLTAEMTAEDIASCLRVLQQACDRPELVSAPNSPLGAVAAKASLLMRRLKAEQKRQVRERDVELQETAAIRARRQSKVDGRCSPETSNVDVKILASFSRPKSCYICKSPYVSRHPFYDALCPTCGDENYAKRNQSADLSGRRAILTGGRVKIGFQTALKLLRAGADVLITSRFPADAARRYTLEADFESWSDRLSIWGLDLRWLPSVEQFCDEVLARWSSLDILIHNAAQTIRRPTEFFAHLVAAERELISSLSPPARRLIGNGQLPVPLERPLIESQDLPALATQYFPTGLFDGDGQQVDGRPRNSWVLRLADVSFAELLEVHAVNSLAPFMVLQRLEPLLLADTSRDRFVVNVSAVEGQFNTRSKTGLHPHTNMAKAGLNMLTRTCGEFYAQRRVFMNSVDTGWVTNEFPLAKTAEMREAGFEPPLDEVDGAARVLDPIFCGVVSGEPTWGKFLKDYRETAW